MKNEQWMRWSLESTNSNWVEAAGLLLFTRMEPVQFLLLRHVNRWDLPKGHAESDETLLQTALRETEEETGIAGSHIDVDQNFRFVMQYWVQGKKRGDYHKQVTYFLGTVDRPVELDLTEHVGYQWWNWPVRESIQAQTIDPLLAAVAQYWGQPVG